MAAPSAVATRQRIQRAPGSARTAAPSSRRSDQATVLRPLGNQEMGALLSPLQVQRSSCGGSCGCGGTCGGGAGSSAAKIPDADELADAPVQRLHQGDGAVAALAGPVARPRRSAQPAPVLLAAMGPLQRNAGNAAVASLVAQRQEPEVVQRLGLEDLLPDWISGAIFGAKDRAAGAADKAKGDGERSVQEAEHQAAAVAGKVDVQAPKLLATTEATVGKAEAAMAAGGATVAAGKAKVEQAKAETHHKLATEAAKTHKASMPAAVLGGEQPSCSLAKVANGVEHVADIIGKPFGISGAQLVRNVGRLISGVGRAVSAGLRAIGGLVQSAKRAYKAADDWVKGKLGVDIATIGKWIAILSNPISMTRELGRFVVGKVAEGIAFAGRKLGELGRFAMAEGPRLLAGVRARLGSWFSRLPSPLRSAISAIAAPYRLAFGAIQGVAASIAGRLRPKADAAKAKADDAASKASGKVEDLQHRARDAKSKKEADISQAASAKAAETAATAKQEGDGPAKAGEQRQKALGKEGEKEADKLAHRVCAELDTAAGPCVAEYLPNPGAGKGAGNASTLSSTVAAEVTIPIPETGISAKVGAGSKIDVSHLGDGGGKTYTVTITGDSMLYANVGGGTDPEPSADVKLDLPGGGKGNLTKVWDHLGGKADVAAAAAPGAPSAPGGEVKAKGDVDAGYHAQSVLVYAFTAGATNCDGLGGLTALLGLLGVQGAGGFLGEMAMMAAGGSFENILTSRKLTLAQGVTMSGEVAGAFAKAGIKVGVEAGVTAGQDRDAKTGKMVDTIELFASASGEGSFELEHDVLSGIGGGANASGRVGVTLGYGKDPASGVEQIDVLKLGASASAGAQVSAVSLSKIGEVAGPEAVRAIRDAAGIGGTSLDPTSAALKGDVSVTVEPTTATASLGGVLSDPAVASQANVLDKAKEALKKLKATGNASLTLTMSERLAGVSVEAEEREPGMNTGAKASAALDRSESRVIWAKAF